MSLQRPAPYVQPTIENVVRLITDGQEVGYCPMGYAHGCFEIRTRGYGLDYAGVTMWPNPHFRLFTGGDSKFRMLDISGLWQQEIYVYLRELGEAVQEALDALKIAPTKDVGSVCEFCHATFFPKGYAKFCSRPCGVKFKTWQKLQIKIAAKENPDSVKHCVSYCRYCSEPIPRLTRRQVFFCDAQCSAKFRKWGSLKSTKESA